MTQHALSSQHVLRSRWTRSALALLACGALLLTLFALKPLVAHAASNAYYIDNSSNSHCSNSGAGTTTSVPWCDFTNVNSHTFGPGDQIFLARGDTWYQAMSLHGSGTSWSTSAFITVDAYGTGAAPIIRGNGNASDRTIVMPANPNYWSISDLELSNAGMGIIANYTTLGNQGLRFNNLNIHDISGIEHASPVPADFPSIYNSAAITVGVLGTGSSIPATPTANQWVVKDIQITNTESANSNGFYLWIVPKDSSNANYPYTDFPTTSIQQVTIKNCYVHNPPLPSLAMEPASNVTILDNRFDFAGHTPEPSNGTTGAFFFYTSSVTLTNNTLENMNNTGDPDQTASDNEGYDDHIAYRGNYIANNAGAGTEFLALGGRTGDYSTNHEVSANAFANNDTSGNSAQHSSLLFNNQSGEAMTGTASNNLYYEPTGFDTVYNHSINWTFTNNQSVGSAANLYAAGDQFSGTQGQNQWSYQYDTPANGGWTNISTYDTTNQRWGSNGYTSRFDTLPDTCATCWIARAWTAPSTGTISVRGWVLKNDVGGGDGVLTRITKNGMQVWPTSGGPQAIAAADGVGVAANLDGVSVTAGDVLRFEISDGGNGNSANDATSWSPSVGYTTGMSQGGNPALIDDTSTSVSYSSGWSAATGLDANTWYNGTSHYSNTTNATASYTCASCVEIEWDATKSPDAGIANISIDGSQVTTVDLYASSRQLSRARFGTGVFGSPGQHTLTITVSGTQNPNATANYIEIDAFQAITSAPLVDDTSGSISYSSGWNAVTGLDTNTWYDGTSHYANTTSASATYTCASCVEIEWDATKSPDAGIATIYVDGTLVTTVDMYASSRQISRMRFGTGVFGSPGQHSLEITVSGTRNSAATADYIEIDAFQAF